MEKQQKGEIVSGEYSNARDYGELQEALAAVDDVLDKVSAFNSITSEEDLNQVIPGLLASLGRYSMSDRAYIFTWVSEQRQVLHMTHEWCAEGVLPTIHVMQDLKLSDMPDWAPRLRRGEAIVSMDWKKEQSVTPEEYAVFDGQDIRSLIVIPIFANKRLNGYIGFDNPEHSMTTLSVRILKSVGAYIGGVRENLFMMKELERKQHSLEESLDELKKIIAEHEKQKEELEEALTIANLNSEIVGAISKIYWLIYRMDLVLGTYEEISAGNEVHQLTGKRGRTAEVFKEVRESVVVPEHQEIMKKFLDTSTLAYRLQETESIAMEYQANSGSWHLARFVVKKRDAHGQVTNVLYVVRQIDKQKQMELEYREKLLETAEEARRANIAKTDFLRRMSHDIRTPINGIQGMVRIAEHYPDDMQKQKECRDKVKEASGFLLDLVNSVLDMNKLESGAVVLEHEPFDLRQLLLESDNIVKMSAEVEKLNVSFEDSRIQHSHLLGSALHLKQVLQNIAGNAVKYNREGGSIQLSCEELSCDGKTAVYRFCCKDTGCGMSEAFLQHAFEPFAQEDQGARTAYMGTGLGLSIAKQLVEMMDGTIEVESTLHVGSTFTIVIPFALDNSYEKEEPQTEESAGKSLKGVKVLLVEDNELNMEIAEFLLMNAGMAVTKAYNGKEALDLFAESEDGYFDFILMDVMMPVMDGLTATRRIRELSRTDAGRVPIFAMTANAFAEDKKQSREAGMNEHLSKPLNEELLIQTFRKYLPA